VHVEGVEFDGCGQADFIGRYPLHFHMAAAVAPGTYVRAASVHDSNFRAVTLHGTQGVLVERVVAVDVLGHAFFFEVRRCRGGGKETAVSWSPPRLGLGGVPRGARRSTRRASPRPPSGRRGVGQHVARQPGHAGCA
jgi:hypothetical protein